MLLWKHVTQQHLATLRRPHDEPCEVLSTQKPDPAATGCSPSWRALRELAAADAAGLDAHQEAVLVDLYGGALRQGEAWGFSDTKLSVLVGLVKETHMGSVTGRMTLESSFQAFKEGLLRHSVQRPPFSMGVFTDQDVRCVLQWGIDTYFRHYKLYQYAFTERVTLDVRTQHPWELVEAPTTPPLLCTAITDEEHEKALEDARQQHEAEAAAAAEAAARAAEEEAARRVEEEYELALPDDVRAGVQHALEKELAELRSSMEQEFKRRYEALVTKLGPVASGSGV